MKISNVKIGDRLLIGRSSKIVWVVLDISKDDHLVKIQEEGTDYKPEWADVSIFERKAK